MEQNFSKDRAEADVTGLDQRTGKGSLLRKDFTKREEKSWTAKPDPRSASQAL